MPGVSRLCPPLLIQHEYLRQHLYRVDTKRRPARQVTADPVVPLPRLVVVELVPRAEDGLVVVVVVGRVDVGGGLECCTGAQGGGAGGC